MIKVNGVELDAGHFPDGSQHIKFNIDNINISHDNTVTWLYDSDEELFTLMCLSEWMDKNHAPKNKLFIPYLANARMDRVKSPNDNFSLKTFAKFINSLNFKHIVTVNVHSDVSLALIDNITNLDMDFLIMDAFRLSYRPDVIFFPDEGACKRYSDYNCLKEFQKAFGIKVRDFATGEIKSLDIHGADVKDKTVTIIDDICSYGGTFYYSAKKLKELGAKRINLIVSHCENSIIKGKLFNEENLIENVYTTDSICTIEHEKIYKLMTYRI